MTNWNDKTASEKIASLGKHLNSQNKEVKTAFDVHTVMNGIHQVFHALDPLHTRFTGNPEVLHHLQEQAHQADQGMSTSPWVQDHALQRYLDNHQTTDVDVPKALTEGGTLLGLGALAYFKNRKKLRQYNQHLVECHGFHDIPRAIDENEIDGSANSPSTLSNLHEHDHLYNDLGEYEHTHYPFGYQGK